MDAGTTDTLNPLTRKALDQFRVSKIFRFGLTPARPCAGDALST
jgi:hypothetical protein